MSLRIPATMNYNYKSNAQRNSGVTSPQFRHQSKQITFGDGDAAPYYDYKKAMSDLRQSKTKVEGNTPEEAFGNLYKAITKQLSKVFTEEEAKIEAHGKASRDYDVDTRIPVSEEKYVKSMSGFARDYGIKGNLADPETAIVSHITNKMGIAKTGWLDGSKTPFKLMKSMMSGTYDFLKQGLVTIKNLK